MELTSEEKAARATRLANKEHLGAVMRDFARHAGFKVLQELLDKEINKISLQIIEAKTPEECWKFKCEAAPYQKVKDLVFKTIAQGDAANIALRLEREPQENLQ